MEIIDKIGRFLTESSPFELVLLAVLTLVPLLAIVVGIAAIVRGAKRRRMQKKEEALVENKEVFEKEVCEPMSAPAVVYLPVEKRPIAPASPAKPKAPARVQVKVTNLKKADKALLAATGIFGIGLGFMISQAVGKKKK